MICKTTTAGSGTSPPTGTRSSSRGETRRQIGRFLVVGGSSVAVDLACYALLASAGWSLEAAKALSYLAGLAVGFLGNKFWTFRSARKSLSEPALYLALYACTLLVNVGVNRGVLIVLGPAHAAAAFFCATGLTTVLNFLGMRLVAFRRGIALRLEVQQAAEEATKLAA